MMDTLNEKEWLLVNDIVKDIYACDEIKKMEETFLLLIRKLVPYKMAVFSIVNDDYTVDADRSAIIGDDEESMQVYNEKYAELDYTNDILTFPRSTVYRDTDIIDEEQKRKTPFYREWLQKAGCDYSGGLVIRADSSFCACITFFRSDLYGTLKDKELFILELFIGHLENILTDFIQEKRQNLFHYEQIPGYEMLSGREKEILPFILRGYSNKDLAEQFCISDSTAKKHVYNILVKFNVGSRGELIRRCLS